VKIFGATTMIEGLKHWLQGLSRVCADADELTRLYGHNAYEKARERARGFDVAPGNRADYWDCVRREIGRRDFVAVAQWLTW
jgi:hypothetical protein